MMGFIFNNRIVNSAAKSNDVHLFNTISCKHEKHLRVLDYIRFEYIGIAAFCIVQNFKFVHCCGHILNGNNFAEIYGNFLVNAPQQYISEIRTIQFFLFGATMLICEIKNESRRGVIAAYCIELCEARQTQHYILIFQKHPMKRELWIIVSLIVYYNV
eukprot:248577_1